MAGLIDEARRQNRYGDAAAGSGYQQVPGIPKPSQPSATGGLIQYAPNYGAAGLAPSSPSTPAATSAAGAGRGFINPPMANPSASTPNAALSQQAASDREAMGRAWYAAKGMSEDAGRAIADVATAIPRGLVGAYDTAVVRPMRAAGLDAAYLSPHLVPAGVDPSSMTPFTDQKRMREANAPAQPADTPPTAQVAASPSSSAASTPSAAATTSGDATMPGYDFNARPPSFGETAVATAQNDIKRVGNSYSGTNIGPNATINNKTPGGGYIEVPSQGRSLLQAAGLRGGIGIQTPMGDFQSADNAIRAANIRDGLPVNAGLDGSGPASYVLGGAPRGFRLAPGVNAEYQSIETQRMRDAGQDPASLKRAAEFRLEQARQNGQNQRSLIQAMLDQERQAQNYGLARDKFNLDSQTQGIANQGASLLQRMREQIANEPDDTKRTALGQRIREIQGGQTADPYLVVPGGQQIDDVSGKAYNTPSSVFNRQTGQFVEQQKQGWAQGAVPPPKESLVSGQIYDTPSGKLRWNGSAFERLPA